MISPYGTRSPLFKSFFTAFATISVAANLAAANVFKADNADSLNLGSSWGGGVPPASTDIATWDGTVTAAYTLNLGATANWAGIQMLSPGGAVIITNVTTTLLIGGAGVDTSAGSQTLTLACPVSLATNNANSLWNLGSGVTLSGGLNGTNILEKTGTGVLTLSTGSGNATIQIDSGPVTVTTGGAGLTNALNGGQLNLNAAVNNPINVMPSGGTLNASGRTLSGPITGSGIMTVISGSTLSFGGNIFSNFSGTIASTSTTQFRPNSTSFTGGTNATFDLGSSTAFWGPNGTSQGDLVDFGALFGGPNTIVNGANKTTTYEVGAKNIDCFYSGVIRNGNAGASIVNLIKTGTATFALDGASTYTGTTVISNGVLQIGNGGASGSIVSPVVVLTNSTGTLSFNRSDAGFNFTNTITGIGAVRQDGSGTAFLSGPAGGIGNNGYSGGTILNNGILKIAAGALGTGGIIFSNNSATLQWASGTTTDISSQPVTIGASGGQFDVNGNIVTLANSIGNSGSGSLTLKSTAANGVLILQGANTFTGGAVISSGVLKANNSSGSATGSGFVSVSQGATIGGSGTITGQIDLQGILAPGNNGIGTLTVGSLTLESTSTNNFEFNATPANDRVVVTASGGFGINDGIFNFYSEGGTLGWTTPGSYNLIQFNGTGPSLDSSWTTASGSNPHVANPQTGYQYAFSISGGFLKVTITSVSTANIGTWGVDTDGNWSVAGNWTAVSGTMPPRNANDSATFGTGSALRTVTLDANETVGAITMNNANSFVIANGGKVLTLNNSGSGANVTVADGTANSIQTAVSLADNANITVSAGKSLAVSGVIANASASKAISVGGSGTIVLSGNNSYGPPALSGFGTTLVGGGILQVDNNNALGAGDVSISANGTLRAGVASLNVANNVDVAPGTTATLDDGGNNLTLSGVISDSGSLAKIGNGSLTLGGNNTYTGNTTVSAGVLDLSADANVSSTPNIILNGGDLRGTASFALGFGHTIGIGLSSGAIGTNALIDAASGQSFEVDSTIASAGNSGVNNLIVNSGAGNNGTLILNGANTFNGTTVVSNGTLQVMNPLALQNSTLDYNSGTLTFDANLFAATLAGLTGTNNLSLTNLANGLVALTVGNGGVSSAYSGSLSDAAVGSSLIKVGNGTLSLSGSNSYAGATTLGGGMLILTNGGQINSAAAVTINNGGGSTFTVAGGFLSAASMVLNNNNIGFIQNSGTSSFSGTVTYGNDNANSGDSLQILGGTFNAGALNSGRSSLNLSAQPAAGQGLGGNGIFITNAVVNITNTLGVGGRTSGGNSSTSMRMDDGVLNVGGTTTITLNNGGRWSVLDINGGTFNSADTTGDGIRIGGGYAGGNGLFLVRAGTANVNKITFGDAATQTSGTDVLSVTGGLLYIGAGGLVVANPAPTYGSTITLSGGTVGSSADWSTTIPITLVTNIATFQTTDVSNAPHNITLSGVLSGAGGLTKIGNGTLTLTALNTYTSNTTVSAGTLILQQPSLFTNSVVSVATGATLELDFSGANQVAGLVLNGVAKAAGIYNNSTDPAFLAGTGSIQVVIPPTTVNTTPTNIITSVSENTLTLSWPADHTGWTLLTNASSLTDANAWFPYPGSASTNLLNITIDPTKTNVFFRMVYP